MGGPEPTGDPAPTLLEIGHIARAHGLRGQVIVELVSNRPERVAAGSRLRTGPDGECLEVLAARASPSVGGRPRWLVTFAGIDTREQAEALRGVALRAEPLVDVATLWVHELIGATVWDRAGTRLGVVTSVEANPASDLLVLDGGTLIPLRFVVDTAGAEVIVEVPDGLLDL